MAWGAIIGSLLGAGGQIAGGLLGQGQGGQGKNSNYNPSLDYALQASQYAGLDPLGFGQLSSIPDPFQQFIGQLQSTPMPSKNRNAVIKALSVIQNNPELLDDPSGENFTRSDLRGFINNPETMPNGRRFPKGSNVNGVKKYLGAGAAAKELYKHDRSLPLPNLPELKKALRGMGMGVQDLRGIIEEQTAFNAEMQKLKDAGLGGIQTNTILNRAKAAGTAAELLGGAADFARTGQPGQGVGQDLFNRDERQMADLQDRLGVMANFGGINPAQLFDSITDAKLDQNLRLIEQQLGISNALQATLNPATAAASSIAGQGSASSLNAAQIAAQQAQAAAALRSGQSSASSSSMANGVSGGLGSLGSGIGNATLLSSLFGGSNGTTAGFNNVDRSLYGSSDITGYR